MRAQATEARHRAAVLGSPIAHSLSPVLHRAALGPGLILLVPIFLNVLFHGIFGHAIDATVISAVEQIIFGVMIIAFLIFEPLGLARLWQLTKERLRLWPFRH